MIPSFNDVLVAGLSFLCSVLSCLSFDYYLSLVPEVEMWPTGCLVDARMV